MGLVYEFVLTGALLASFIWSGYKYSGLLDRLDEAEQSIDDLDADVEDLLRVLEELTRPARAPYAPARDDMVDAFRYAMTAPVEFIGPVFDNSEEYNEQTECSDPDCETCHTKEG